MRSDELRTLHALFFDVADYLDVDTDYYTENCAQPHHVHRMKDAHKESIAVLSRHLSEEIPGMEPLEWDAYTDVEEMVSRGRVTYIYESGMETVSFKSGEDRAEIHIERNGQERKRWSVLKDLSENTDLKSALEQNYVKSESTMSRKKSYRELRKVLDDEDRLPLELQEDLSSIIEEYKYVRGVENLKSLERQLAP